jgi:preprotein translocase subunit YajC
LTQVALNAAFTLATEEAQPSSGFGGIFFYLIIGVAVWFVFFGPRQRKMKAMRRDMADLRDSLTFGDDVITVGGIYGRVMSTTDHDVTIDLGSGIEMRIARRAIAERLGGDAE